MIKLGIIFIAISIFLFYIKRVYIKALATTAYADLKQGLASGLSGESAGRRAAEQVMQTPLFKPVVFKVIKYAPFVVLVCGVLLILAGMF